jgi:hypothetical protein
MKYIYFHRLYQLLFDNKCTEAGKQFSSIRHQVPINRDLRFATISGIRNILLVTAIVISSFIAPNKAAAQISVKASFDSAAILIGDQIHFNLFVEQPLDAKVSFPEFKDTIIGKVVIVSDL